MDDLIGTQTPRRRLTDPAEAIRALERAVPGLAGLRRPVPASVDWATLEDGLGTVLPADFKLLAELYPTFVLGDFLAVGLPEPGSEQMWAAGATDLEIIEEWLQDADESVALRVYPAPGGLLGWAESNGGDFFLWSTCGAGSSDWTVTVASRSGGWWHYAGGAVQFLSELVDGTVSPWGLPRIGGGVVTR